MKKEIAKRVRFGVRLKLISVVLGLGAILLGVSLFVIYDGYKKFVFSEQTKKLEDVSKLIVERIESEFTNLRYHLSFVASHNKVLIDAVEKADAAYAGSSEEETLRHLKEIDASWNGAEGEQLRKRLLKNEAAAVLKDLIIMSNLPISEIFITDRMGAEVAASQKTTDYYQADEMWWQKAFNNGKGDYYFSGLEYDESSHVYAFTIACPVKNLRGDVIGVLKVVVDKDLSLKRIFHIFLGQGGLAGVMSARGVDIFHLSFGSKVVDRKVFENLFDFMILRKGKGTRIIEGEGGRPLLVGFWKVGGRVFGEHVNYVYCLQDLAQALPALKKIILKLSVLWFILVLCLYFLIFLISKKFIKPLEMLKRGFDHLKKGLFDHKLAVLSGDELEDVANDFNLMVEDLRKSTISKDYFNQIIQNMSDILFVVDAYGVIDLVNRRTCEVLGYTEEELKGKEAIQIFSKKDRFVLGWGLKGLIEEGSLKDKKINLITKSGREVEVYLGTRLMRGGDDKLIGLVCLAKDLTQVNKLMEELKKSTQEALRHKEEVEQSLQQLMEARDVMLSILEDTDEAKRALEETLKKLKEAQDELLQAEKMISLGQIAAGVAHEINNPLFVISGEAEMLKMEDGVPPSVKASISIIQEQIKRIEEIIKRLLEFSRKKESKFTSIDVHEPLEKTIELLQYQTKLLGHVKIVKKLFDEPLLVNGDQNQLQEVFLNMMINGIDAMQEKGGTLTVCTFSGTMKEENAKESSKFRAGDEIIHIQFSDTGIGMDEETQKRVFDPFFTTKKTGIGLGLSVCFGIVENHGGLIQLESRLGQGTTFTVKLPLLKPTRT